MKSKYKEIVKHIHSIDDHGNLYMYYGIPYSEECFVYGEDDEDGNLILSDECDALCRAIAEEFQYEFKWIDILQDNKIRLEEIFTVDVEAQNLDVIAAILLYLVESIVMEDKFIDALNNGYMLRVLKRLEYWDTIENK